MNEDVNMDIKITEGEPSDFSYNKVLETEMRIVAREEIASLCGLMLRRLQDEGPTRSFERNAAVDILSGLFGEALADFSSKSAPGE